MVVVKSQLCFGKVFEKVGVNISTLHGVLSPEFSQHISGALEAPQFFATSIYISTSVILKLVKYWFGVVAI